MGRLRDPRVLQHHATTSKDLRQRRRRPGGLLRIRRSLRNLLQRPRRQVPGPTRRDAAEDVMPSTLEQLRFKQLDPRAVLPRRGSALAAGLDVCSIEDLQIGPRQRVMARTGLAVAIPPGFYGRIAPRSGLAAKSGLDVLSGVIDSDYRGEVICLLYNTGDEM